MIRIAGSLLALALAGCAHCPPVATIGLPERPELIPVSPEVWSTVGAEAQDVWTLNDLALKEYARKLESRIAIHDEALE